MNKKITNPKKTVNKSDKPVKSQDQQIAETVVKTKKLRYVQQLMEDIEKNPPAAPSPEFIKQLFSGSGRRLTYPTVEAMEERIQEYFLSLMVEVKDKETGETEGYRWFGRPTLSGLALWLGMSREGVANYSKREAYSDTIKSAKTLIENFNENALNENRNPAGMIFILKNGFGWRDIQDVRIEPINPLGDITDQRALAEKAAQDIVGEVTEIE